MKFDLRLDRGALVNLPDVKGRTTAVQVNDSEMVIQFGAEFDAHIDLHTVATAEQMDDPRPTVFFPMGVCTAVERFGQDTLCIITSYDGLVRIKFDREVGGNTTPTDFSGKGRPASESVPIQFRSLILSMADPQGFVAAINQGGRTASRSVT